MASRTLQLGPVGEHLSTVVAELRHQRTWDQRTLAARVTDCGRPMSASVLGKIEGGTRRVDVDDLVAFAAAFEVRTSRLLPPGADDQDERAADPFADDTAPGLVRARVLDDIAALGDLEQLDVTAPTLAAVAVRLAQQIDDPSAFALHSLAKELRAVLAELRSLTPEGPDDDDDDGDLASPD
ncbi:helix-turn-helix domain-containing protein [Streptomyces niveus]